MKRIHMHWTAGSHKVSDLDRRHYHFIVDGSGQVHEGNLKPEANLSTSDGQYVAHTRGANTGAIGVAMAAMAGARERPFTAGKYPITDVQYKAFVRLVAELADTYDIEIEATKVLTHAEIQPTLGIKQNGKWDIMWLPGMSKPADPVDVGGRIRRDIKAVKLGEPEAPPAVEVEPQPSLLGEILSVIFRRFS